MKDIVALFSWLGNQPFSSVGGGGVKLNLEQIALVGVGYGCVYLAMRSCRTAVRVLVYVLLNIPACVPSCVRSGYLASSAAVALQQQRLVPRPRLARLALDRPVSNLVTYVEGTAPYGVAGFRREFGGGEIRELLQSLSPTRNCHEIHVGCLTMRSGLEGWVLSREATQLRDALRAKGQGVWDVVARDESGVWHQPRHQVARLSVLASFLMCMYD